MYVVLYQLVYNYGAVLVEQPLGRVRLSLRSKTSSFGCDPVEDQACTIVLDPFENQSYCLQNPQIFPPCAADQYPTSNGKRHIASFYIYISIYVDVMATVNQYRAARSEGIVPPGTP